MQFRRAYLVGKTAAKTAAMMCCLLPITCWSQSSAEVATVEVRADADGRLNVDGKPFALLSASG